MNLAYSMHLAYSADGVSGFTALNDNSGLLYMRAATNSNETMTRKGMKNPYLFYCEDGSFGVAATRVEVGGETDGQKASSIMFYTSENLMAYEEVGFLDMKTDKAVQSPVCEFDSAAGVYRITWNDGEGNYYENTVESLNADSAVSEPVSVPAPQVRRADTGIAGAVEGNLLALEKRHWYQAQNETVQAGKHWNGGSGEDIGNLQGGCGEGEGNGALQRRLHGLQGSELGSVGSGF